MYCEWNDTFGTGYLTTGGTVLTAWHVVRGAASGDRVVVRPLSKTAGEPFYRAKTVWPAATAFEPRIDAALLIIDDPQWRRPHIMPVRWGKITGDTQVRVIGLGFPDAANDPDSPSRRRNTLPIRGRIEPLAHAKSSDEYVVVVLEEGSAIPARKSGTNPSPWSGASGTALFHDGSDHLLAVVLIDHDLAADARILKAVPSAVLATDPSFEAEAAAHGLPFSLERITMAEDGLAALSGFHNLPDLPSNMLVGRKDALNSISDALAAGPVVVTGLGGVGKTSVALHYARVHHRRFTAAWWIDASSRALLERGLAELAEHLVEEAKRTWTTQHGAASWATNWLQTHVGWLLVLDNADHSDTVTALVGAIRLAGSIIITSRFADFANAARIHLLVLDRAMSIDLLTQRVEATVIVDRDVAEAANAIAAEVGDLPLALVTAGAYIRTTKTSYADYLRLLVSNGTELHSVQPAGTSQIAISQTWKVTIAAIAPRNPLAVDILRIAAWYAPTAIPRDLFTPLAGGVTALPLALAELAVYSMITLTERDFSVHRIVGTVLRTDPIGPREMTHAQARASARDLLIRALTPREPSQEARSDWTWWRDLVPHVRAVQADTASTDERGPDLADALSRAAKCLIEHGQLDTGIAFHNSALADREQRLGPEHLDTLASRDSLAHAHRIAGNVETALPLHEASLAAYERVLGMDHVDTLTCRSNLAAAYREAGRLPLAISLFTETIAARERILGPEHPDTLASRNSLAYACRVAGDLDRALPLHEAVLADCDRFLGRDHPMTLTARGNLAIAYRICRNYERAISLHESVLCDSKRVLGADHPDTLYARNNLAYAQRASGHLAEAISCHESVLADSVRVLGPGHPDTLIYQTNLAHAHRTAGNLGLAITLFEQTLTDRERVLGPSHPDTLSSRSKLGYAYMVAGELERAVPLLESTYAECDRLFGSDHPTTRVAREHRDAAARKLGKKLSRASTIRTRRTNRR